MIGLLHLIGYIHYSQNGDNEMMVNILVGSEYVWNNER